VAVVAVAVAVVVAVVVVCCVPDVSTCQYRDMSTHLIYLHKHVTTK
jgi:hypothetical protein